MIRALRICVGVLMIVQSGVKNSYKNTLERGVELLTFLPVLVMVCPGSISARFSAIPASFISSAVRTTAETKPRCYRAITPTPR